jgi:hypothetical protein
LHEIKVNNLSNSFKSLIKVILQFAQVELKAESSNFETPTVSKCVCHIYVLGAVQSLELLKTHDFIFSDIKNLNIASEFEISILEAAQENLLPNDELTLVCELEVELSHQVDEGETLVICNNNNKKFICF